MRFAIILLLIVSSLSGFSQVMPYEDMFFWNQTDLNNNRVKKITAYEFKDVKDSIIADTNIVKGEMQTEEYYDNLGRIIIKKNHYPYSDIELKKRELTYLGNRVGTFKYYVTNELVRSETYTWNQERLDYWEVKQIEHGQEFMFTKQILRNMLYKPTNELIKSGKRVISNDTIIYFSGDHSHSNIRYNKKTKTLIDSTVFFNPDGDTLFHKEVYINHLLFYKEVHWHRDNELTQRTEEYEGGVFQKVYYRRLIDNRVILEKQIHVVPTQNYDKFYTYSDKGLPIKKEVYFNTETPSSVIYYEVVKY
jgi:hypothetical protein